jgi:putative ABC transport system ATP-binding protein
MPAPLLARELFRFFHAADEETIALRGVSLTVEAGELVAVTGPSGSGKSTLLACLAGVDEPDGGSVRVAGHIMTRQPEAVRTALRRRHIGVLFQNANLIEHLSVADNVRFARRLCGGRRRTRRTEASESVMALLEALDLAERARARPSALSGGESARAGLAVTLANDPDVVLADEPTGELDAAHQVRVLELLRVRADRGTAVVVATHSPAVATVADRELHLVDGRVTG